MQVGRTKCTKMISKYLIITYGWNPTEYFIYLRKCQHQKYDYTPSHVMKYGYFNCYV